MVVANFGAEEAERMMGGVRSGPINELTRKGKKKMFRIAGLIIVVASMIVFAVGANALPSAKQWIIDDYGFKATGFLAGGIITMFLGATLAFLGARSPDQELQPVSR
jgi:hypothetical protein